MYKVEVGDIEDHKIYDHEFSQQLKITDNNGTRIYYDLMEPEDVRFYRDLSWVQGELESAYQSGYEDAEKDILEKIKG